MLYCSKLIIKCYAFSAYVVRIANNYVYIAGCSTYYLVFKSDSLF